jgi:hypothetical protein
MLFSKHSSYFTNTPEFMNPFRVALIVLPKPCKHPSYCDSFASSSPKQRGKNKSTCTHLSSDCDMTVWLFTLCPNMLDPIDCYYFFDRWLSENPVSSELNIWANMGTWAALRDNAGCLFNNLLRHLLEECWQTLGKFCALLTELLGSFRYRSCFPEHRVTLALQYYN